MSNENINANYFSNMSKQVGCVEDSMFGGAFVVVLPDGKYRSSLLIDDEKDPSQILLVLKSHIDTLLAELDKERNPTRGYR